MDTVCDHVHSSSVQLVPLGLYELGRSLGPTVIPCSTDARQIHPQGPGFIFTAAQTLKTILANKVGNLAYGRQVRWILDI